MSIPSIVLLLGTIIGIVAVITGDHTYMIISGVWLFGSIVVEEVFG